MTHDDWPAQADASELRQSVLSVPRDCSVAVRREVEAAMALLRLMVWEAQLARIADMGGLLVRYSSTAFGGPGRDLQPSCTICLPHLCGQVGSITIAHLAH